jgi:hypothetical protein
MRAIGLVVAAAAASVLTAGAAQAQDRAPCGAGLVCASSPDSVVGAMEKAGFKPKRTADPQGDPMIESDQAPYHFDIFFYGCETSRNCDSLRFEVAFRKDPENTFELANKWNSAHRFLQAAVKDDGRLVVSYDLATIGGLTERNFADVLDWWKSQLAELGGFFEKELKQGAAGPKTR